MDCEIQSEKLGRMDRELNEMTSMSRDDKEIMQLKRLKSELEVKLTDQEEELDDQAGTIQQLEQVAIHIKEIFFFKDYWSLFYSTMWIRYCYVVFI